MSPPSTPLIEVDNIVKRYDANVVLSNISLQVGAGDARFVGSALGELRQRGFQRADAPQCIWHRAVAAMHELRVRL